MTVFALPEKIEALIFDVDSTLYTCPAYANAQIRGQIERLATVKSVSFESMEAEILERRARWAAEHDGQKLSLGNLFVTYGIPIEESVRWREELIKPEDYIDADPRLRAVLSAVQARVCIGVVTNNPEKIGRRTLAALGVEDLFSVVVGLDVCGVSKPHKEPFRRAAASLEAKLEHCVSVGDRYDIDIALPLELGMGGVLVDGVEDVYRLPEILSFKRP
ncbi:MAG: HAD family hydrolase [Treponemataceae bacterium]